MLSENLSKKTLALTGSHLSFLSDIGFGFMVVLKSDGAFRIIQSNGRLSELLGLEGLGSLEGVEERLVWESLAARSLNGHVLRGINSDMERRKGDTRSDVVRILHPELKIVERFTCPYGHPFPGCRLWLFRDVSAQETTKERYRRKALLEDMLRFLTTEVLLADLSRVDFRKPLLAMSQALQASATAVFVPDQKNSALVSPSHYRFSRREDLPEELPKSLIGHLLTLTGANEEGLAVVQAGASGLPELDELMLGRQATSWLLVAIRSQEAFLGLLLVEQTYSNRRWNIDERTFVRAAGSIVGTWLNRAGLHAELQEAREQLESALAARNDFLALVSHELRTPLNPMVGFTQILEETCDCGDPGRLEMIKKVREASLRMQELVEDLLTLIRLDTRRDSWRKYPVDVHSLAGAMEGFFHQCAAGRKLDFIKDIPCDGGFVNADGAALKRALKSLVSNAVRFTPDGGRVTVSILCQENNVRIRVSDTGPGIDPEQMERIFVPFQQVQPVLTRKHAGAGLGLSLAKRVVDAHGGTIDVSNNPENIGCTFEMVLPRILPEDEETAP